MSRSKNWYRRDFGQMGERRDELEKIMLTVSDNYRAIAEPDDRPVLFERHVWNRETERKDSTLFLYTGSQSLVAECGFSETCEEPLRDGLVFMSGVMPDWYRDQAPHR